MPPLLLLLLQSLSSDVLSRGSAAQSAMPLSPHIICRELQCSKIEFAAAGVDNKGNRVGAAGEETG